MSCNGHNRLHLKNSGKCLCYYKTEKERKKESTHLVFSTCCTSLYVVCTCTGALEKARCTTNICSYLKKTNSCFPTGTPVPIHRALHRAMPNIVGRTTPSPKDAPASIQAHSFAFSAREATGGFTSNSPALREPLEFSAGHDN